MTQNLFLNQNFFWTQILFDSILFKTQFFFSFGLIKILPKLNTLDLSLVISQSGSSLTTNWNLACLSSELNLESESKWAKYGNE